MALLLAWVLTRKRFYGRTLLDAFVHLPLVLPPVVVGYILLVLFGTRGPIGGWLHQSFGVQLVFTRNGAALATAVMTFPLMVRAMRISLENIDRGLEEAARTLGAAPLDRFVSITLPLMLPGILAGAITAFSAGLGEFGAVITFVSNIPGETRTLPLALYTALQVPGGDAAAARLAAISFTLGLGGLLISEWFARRVRATVGALMLKVHVHTRRGCLCARCAIRCVPDAGRGRAVRPLRQRQEHADQCHRRAAAAGRRKHLPERPGIARYGSKNRCPRGAAAASAMCFRTRAYFRIYPWPPISPTG